MQISALSASEGYKSALSAAHPTGQSTVKEFADVFSKTMQHAETVAQKNIMGQADTQTLVEALTQAELALDTVVSVRNKVVEAYQEILRMPV